MPDAVRECSLSLRVQKQGGNPKRRRIEGATGYHNSLERRLRAMKRWLLLAILVPIGFAWHSHVLAFGGESAFYEFLGDHPQIRQELEANPNLANEPGYIRDHPQFIEFYRNHDEVRRELARNAPEIMRREEIDNAQRRGGE
jgi:hypothetical protein